MEELNDRISELEDLLEQKKMRISNDSKGINSINTRNRQLNIALNSIYGAKNFEEEDENDPFSRRKTESTLIFHPVTYFLICNLLLFVIIMIIFIIFIIFIFINFGNCLFKC